MSLNFGDPAPHIRLRTSGHLPKPYRTTLMQGVNEYRAKYPWIFGENLQEIRTFARKPTWAETDEMGIAHEGIEGAMGQTYDRGLMLNLDNISDPISKEVEKTEWSVGRSYGTKGLRNVLRHEIGHKFHHGFADLFGQGDEEVFWDKIAPLMSKKFALPLSESEYSKPAQLKAFGEALGSEYATHDLHELFAETFTRSEVPGPGYAAASSTIRQLANQATKRQKMLAATETAAKHLLDIRRI